MKPPARPVVPVSIQAAGEIRRLRVRLKAEATGVLKAATALPPGLIADAAAKGSAGAIRAWDRVRAGMRRAPAVMDYRRRAALWRVLRPVDNMLKRHDGSTPSAARGIVVEALVIGKCRGVGAVDVAPWGLLASDHALGRLLDRTGFTADPVQTLLEGHDALLSASRECIETLLAERSWAIPAGPGAFIATFRGMRYRDGDSIVLATAGTWVASAMLHPNQMAQVAALQFKQVGRTLRDGLMLPAPLRAAARPVDDDQGMMATFEV